MSVHILRDSAFIDIAIFAKEVGVVAGIDAAKDLAVSLRDLNLQAWCTRYPDRKAPVLTDLVLDGSTEPSTRVPYVIAHKLEELDYQLASGCDVSDDMERLLAAIYDNCPSDDVATAEAGSSQ